MRKTKRAVLVYQAGIANVFRVKSFTPKNIGRSAYRVLQADFRTCESFARGLVEAGVMVRTMACNEAGDITNSDWTRDLENQPFSDKFSPVCSEQ